MSKCPSGYVDSRHLWGACSGHKSSISKQFFDPSGCFFASASIVTSIQRLFFARSSNFFTCSSLFAYWKCFWALTSRLFAQCWSSFSNPSFLFFSCTDLSFKSRSVDHTSSRLFAAASMLSIQTGVFCGGYRHLRGGMDDSVWTRIYGLFFEWSHWLVGLAQFWWSKLLRTD